ncbi:PLP-dependent aminotransferase family protein [Fodinisporobacter ferrooxydans]|uniref:PLP-dependent aminotransferase family protein n=1 Tax=Fodinisporobacter ferrooxydans TaxID=2901836 RepID=A0ABY4CL55_9BACL|nr:PLP-dependent aminotransferase family protein [Alicyclobacillaceae bacterium MYW30-H2]
MLWLPIDRNSDLPLFRQVYTEIRAKILHGELHGGERLPSTRELASELQVSRNVILEAFDLLLAEGFIEAKQGSGTFITHGAHLNQEHFYAPLLEQTKQEPAYQKDMIDFRSGIPALDLFPKKLWGRLSSKVCVDLPETAMCYDKPEGRPELREALSKYLLRMRGVTCHPDQIVITSGTTQALSIVAKLLAAEGREVIVEDPITHEVQTIFISHGFSLQPIPVDQNGMQTEQIPPTCKPAFVYVTPSHQFPLGATLPIKRRIDLIRFARMSNCFIVEDDYDSEYRYEGPPISSLQGLDPKRVVYLGTFSKTVLPSLRIGFMVLPWSLIEQVRKLKWLADLHTPSIDQLILARFIEDGHFDRHVSKMKKIYRNLRNTLVRSLKITFGDKVQIFGDSTGMHLVARFEGIEFTNCVLEEMNAHGVQVYPVEAHVIKKGRRLNESILGYGNLSVEKIEEGVRRMYEAISVQNQNNRRENTC